MEEKNDIDNESQKKAKEFIVMEDRIMYKVRNEVKNEISGLMKHNEELKNEVVKIKKRLVKLENKEVIKPNGIIKDRDVNMSYSDVTKNKKIDMTDVISDIVKPNISKCEMIINKRSGEDRKDLDENYIDSTKKDIEDKNT